MGRVRRLREAVRGEEEELAVFRGDRGRDPEEGGLLAILGRESLLCSDSEEEDGSARGKRRHSSLSQANSHGNTFELHMEEESGAAPRWRGLRPRPASELLDVRAVMAEVLRQQTGETDVITYRDVPLPEAGSRSATSSPPAGGTATASTRRCAARDEEMEMGMESGIQMELDMTALQA